MIPGKIVGVASLLVPVLLIPVLLTSTCLTVAAQDKKGNTTEVKRTWRVGASIQGAGKPVTNLIVTFPVPTDWPEQHVNVYKENIPQEASRAEFRDSNGVRQMVARIPRVDERAQVEINVILDIVVSAVPYPDRTDHLVIPERAPREVRIHLSPSPLIESRKRSIKTQTKQLADTNDSAWEQVRSIYEFVTSEIDVEGKKVIGAEKTLKQKKGSAEDLSNLFVAMCRSKRIPARIVWADNGEYAEFYLHDDDGYGRWYPAVLEGQVEFGQMTHPSVIIQKGDNIKIPEKHQRQRFVVEYVSGSGAKGVQPRVRFLRDVMQERDRDGNQ